MKITTLEAISQAIKAVEQAGGTPRRVVVRDRAVIASLFAPLRVTRDYGRSDYCIDELPVEFDPACAIDDVWILP